MAGRAVPGDIGLLLDAGDAGTSRAAPADAAAAGGRWDATLLMAWLALLVVGIVMVASASAGQRGGTDPHLMKHIAMVLASLLVFAVCAAIPLRAWQAAHKPCLLTALALCALVLAPFLSVEVNGARRWLDLGWVRFQPAEAAKLLVAVYLAGYIARAGERLATEWSAWFLPLAWIGVLLALVLCQPDFGSVVVLAALTVGLLFLGGARLRDFALLVLLGGLALAAAAMVQPYRVERMVTFLDPWATQFDGGYQLTQALIAFGRGGYTGLGLGQGVQKLFYLPEAHNDFIYAVIAEELGLLGAVGVLALFAVLTLRLFRIARAASVGRRVFAALLAYAAALLVGGQALINAGVNTGVLPTKGLTLPFISFGGNSLLVCSALVALALRAHYEGTRAGGEANDR